MGAAIKTVSSTVHPSTIVVVGADGFVGAGLAAGLGARRVVYGSAHNGDIPIQDAAKVLAESNVIINAGGFRVRPGCAYTDYQRSHQGAAEKLVPLIPPSSCFIHISSASVLGKSSVEPLGCQSPTDPESFPSAAYALAKLEADRYLCEASTAHGFRLILIRPAVVYSPQGAGMVGTLLKLAREGIFLRLYPERARHHFCHMDLLTDVVGRVIARLDASSKDCWVVADPYTVTSSELLQMVKTYCERFHLTLPMPVHWLYEVLRRAPHSVNPRWDFKTWGEIFGVLDLNTQYDPSDTFSSLNIDPGNYSLEKTLQPLIRESLAA